MFHVVGTGLWGEEVPLVSLEGLLNFWMETRRGADNKRYMMITLLGRFKGEVDSRWHMVPICDKTRSNIPFRLWMERLMQRRVNCQHRNKGWLFETKTGAQAKFGKYDTTFQSLLTLACATNSRLVASAVKTDDFGQSLAVTQEGRGP